jgi:hypothetical protein
MRRPAPTHHHPTAASLLSAALTALLLAACGTSTHTAASTHNPTNPTGPGTQASGTSTETQASSNPNEAVARVAGTPITRAQVDHWMTNLGGTTYYFVSHQMALPEGLLSDPANYGHCVATIEREASKSPLGHAVENSTELLTKCHELNEALKRYATSYLIEVQQALHIAQEQHVTPALTQITRKYNEIKAREYPTTTALNQYLTSHRATIPDLILQAKISLIANAYLAKIKPETPLGHAQYITYEKRWITQTTCQPNYTVPDCNNKINTNLYPHTPPPSVLMEQIAATITDKCYDPKGCAKQAQ